MRIRVYFLRRWVPYMVDMMISLTIPTILMIFIHFIFPSLMENMVLFVGLLIILSCLFMYLYEMLFFSKSLQTIGKTITKLKVEFTQQARPSYRTIYKIGSVYLILPAIISALMINFGDPRSSMHDRIVQSLVLPK